MKAHLFLASLFVFTVLFSSCNSETKKPIALVQNQSLNRELVLEVMQKHLEAISKRDLETLESTLSPEGNMQLILPGTEIIEKTSGFMDYHREWFKSNNWTLKSEILNSDVGEIMASVVVESIYKEPERDGKPYFNRMHVSYVLKKTTGKWFVIKDHMASVEKSTYSE
ncbi:hypothetical protein FEE95_10135 [Maribacter algarum]|uniref:SnoaL-like domain-containing protein n=1 Tax=Maribacter algarum (ex Zhang et al. 2020) TaxID=2578118 RepID=A0A5S3PQE3_9FLAO|nr:nuclear transport factor 2 family protein [Maribacter algarum]TMM56849.1 hypothetical protein FEE95_10135 [Maribacter algarum]